MVKEYRFAVLPEPEFIKHVDQIHISNHNEVDIDISDPVRVQLVTEHPSTAAGIASLLVAHRVPYEFRVIQD